MIYNGSCHCGRIAFEVEGDLQQVVSCNCSLCSRRGHLLWFVPREKLHLKTPTENLVPYKFHKKIISHYFCPNCGCGPFGEGKDKAGALTAAINARCLENIDLSAIKTIQFDGKKLP